jgi:hypothetical protein
LKIRENILTGARKNSQLLTIGNACLLTIASLSGPLVFILVMSVIGVLQSGYDPIKYMISRLVIGSFGWLQTSAFFVFGILLIVLASRLY